MEDFGWKIYAAQHPLPSHSLTPVLQNLRWSTRDLIRHQNLAKRSWESRKFISRPLGPVWSTKFHPVMAISSSRLVVAAGNALYCYRFMPRPVTRQSDTPSVLFERKLMLPKDPRQDITGVGFEPDGKGLVLSFLDGALGRMPLPPLSERRPHSEHRKPPELTYFHEKGQSIRSLSVVNTTMLTIDSFGNGTLYSLYPQYFPTSSVSAGGSTGPSTGWSTHLSLRGSAGFAVFGLSSTIPLVAHGITPTGLTPYPQAILSLTSQPLLSPQRPVYSIAGGTPHTCPGVTTSDQIIISGWYHGMISVHDLRCPTHTGTPSGQAPHLLPVQIMQDSLSLSPIYSLSSAGTHIAAGSARNSVVHLYDVRSPRTGWSIYLPQSQTHTSSLPSWSSAVYSCLLEGTRLWAATDSRPFVVDFGEVRESTYPAVVDPFSAPSTPRTVGWHTPVWEHNGQLRALYL